MRPGLEVVLRRVAELPSKWPADHRLEQLGRPLVRNFRSFLDRRRAVRPEGKYREPTEQEWRDFLQYFQTRKLELGECSRPYGTPCRHEHACLTEMVLNRIVRHPPSAL
jgi:hypothetical protein